MPPLSEEPTRAQLRAPARVSPHLAPHLAPHVGPHGAEAGAAHAALHAGPHTEAYLVPQQQQQPGMLRRATVAARSAFGLGPRSNGAPASDNGSVIVETGHPIDEYDSDMVDLLDVIGMRRRYLANTSKANLN
jgi:hypothetical protein